MDKELEKVHLEHFKLAFDGFPSGTVVQSEGPDFLIQGRQSTIGIEHTQMFQPGPTDGGSLQAQEKLRLKLLEHTQDRYSSAGGPALSAFVIFFPNKKISSKYLNNVAYNLAEVILREAIRQEHARFLQLSPITCDLPHPIAGVNILIRPGSNRSSFSPLEMGWIPAISSSDILSRIADKETKIIQYEKKCDEIWLLIVANEIAVSSTVDLSQEAIQYSYSTNFDRLFFLWNFHPKCLEFTVAKKSWWGRIIKRLLRLTNRWIGPRGMAAHN
jgi:hypothetical protein